MGETKPSPSEVAFQIPQALAAAQDAQHGHQQQVPGWDANAPPHADIRNRLEVADQIEIVYGCRACGHREEAIPPSSTHARSPGKRAYDTL